MSEFDPFDDELADALKRRAGAAPGAVGTAHEAVLARASHIRRRRGAVVSGIAIVALLVGGVTLLRTGAGDTLAPADTSVLLPPVPDRAPETSATPTTSEQPGRDAAPAPAPVVDNTDVSTTAAPSGTTSPPTAPETTELTGAATTSPDTSGTTAVTVPGPTPTTIVQLPTSSSPTPVSAPTTDVQAPPPTATTIVQTPTPSTTLDSSPTSTVDTSSSTSTSEVAPTSIPPFTRTYQALGGSIRVDWNGTALTLLDVAPAAGFEAEIEDNEPLRIRVRFRGDDDDSRIEIRVDDGELTESIS